jgi:hypothetical protein
MYVKRNLTSGLFISGMILLAYGYLSRMAHLYFFWDSKILGWILIYTALLSFLIDIRRARKRNGKKRFWVTFFIACLALGFLISPIAVVLIKTSEAYNVAIEYLKNDLELQKEIGEVRGFGLIPSGSVTGTTTINPQGSTTKEYAEFWLTVRGSRRYKDIIIQLSKWSPGPWEIVNVRNQ